MSNATSCVVALLGALSCFSLACDRSPPPELEEPASTEKLGMQTVRASGSSALQPLLNAAKERFEVDSSSISVEVSAGGSNKGLADVAAGAVHIGNSDIFAPADVQNQLVDHKVAVVGFAAMANKGPFNEAISSLTLSQLADVFTGTVTDWKDLGGAPQRIVVINRASGSGTRTVFGNAVLGGDKFIEAQTEDNSGALVAKLKQTRGAISYLGLSFKDASLFTIPIKTDKGIVEPSPETIATGAYPIWAYEHMYTRGEPTGATKQFLDYVLSAQFQSNVLPSVSGFISIRQMKVARDKD